MNAIQRLCSRGAFLQEGRLTNEGSAADVVKAYLSTCGSEAANSAEWIDLSNAHRFGTGDVQFRSARYRSDLEAAGFQAYPEGQIEFTMRLESKTAKTLGSVAVTFYTLDGTKLVNADTISLGQVVEVGPGLDEVQLTIKRLYLNPGVYRIGLYLADPMGSVLDHIESAFEINVADLETDRLGQIPVQHGSVFCDFQVAKGNHHADRRADN